MISLNFNFLEEDISYKAIIYKDGENAHWEKNPKDILIEQIEINSLSQMNIELAPGGGFAMSLMID